MDNRVITGDCFDVLPELDADSVHCVMTSPPYYGLRDYGVDGQIGLEETLSEYIDRLVKVGDELRRVLRPDGSWWLNLGDSFNGSGPSNHNRDKVGAPPPESGARDFRSGILGFRYKDKMLVPHRGVIALQEAGWIVRNDAVWAKPNPMPEPVTDRLSTTFEFVFHLVQEPDYWYDLDAIREPHSDKVAREIENATPEKRKRAFGQKGSAPERNDSERNGSFGNSLASHPNGKNPGDVFEITTEPYPDAHFAVYPPELCGKPIKATCPPDGVVLDPFAGAGTTLLKAKRLDRQFIGIELNPEYADMARARVGLDVQDPTRLRESNQGGLEVYE